MQRAHTSVFRRLCMVLKFSCLQNGSHSQNVAPFFLALSMHAKKKVRSVHCWKPSWQSVFFSWNRISIGQNKRIQRFILTSRLSTFKIVNSTANCQHSYCSTCGFFSFQYSRIPTYRKLHVKLQKTLGDGYDALSVSTSVHMDYVHQGEYALHHGWNDSWGRGLQELRRESWQGKVHSHALWSWHAE